MGLDKSINLRVPGPTPLPPAVREALQKQMINHRGTEYAALQGEVLEGLRHFFRTEQSVLLLAASGTGGLEAAIVNILSPGDEVLAAPIGVFGERFAKIAEAYGATVHRVETPWGKAASPEALGEALRQRPNTKAVLLTANETSTGVLNDIEGLAAAVHNSALAAPLLLVDAISALGAVDLPMDECGIDVMVTGSQKAWMAPPGMSMIGVSERAWTAQAQARMPRFYFDFAAQQTAQSKGQDAWTPAVGVMFALRAALRLMLAEGREAIIARHARLAKQTGDGLERLGLELYAEPGYRSPTVTAALAPEGIAAKALIAQCQRRNVVITGGQDRLAEKLLRIGHMGWVSDDEIDEVLGVMRQALLELSAPQAAGSGRHAG